MDYEQKYKEALERAKDFMNGEVPYALKRGENIMCWIFPELRESEDERIRKELIKETKGSEERLFETVTNEEFIAWLEKQGQVKESPISQHENKTCKENDDSLTGEDERIRKALIELVHDTTGDELWVDYNVHKEEALAWLEKQGVQILANSEKTCKDEQKSTDKVKPKFKVGDWIVYTGYLLKYSSKAIYVMQVASVEDDRYNFTDTSTLCFDSEKDMRLWTTQDAKDGDVLASNSSVFLFKEEYIAEKPIAYCGTMNGRFIKGEDVCWTNQRYYPATKEQRELLFQKMKEAGYEWNADKKELKKIESETEIPYGAKDSELQEVTYYIPKGFHAEIDDNKVVIKKGEKPTTWSEEDEKTLVDCFNVLHRSDYPTDKVIEIVDWLKSLKNRVQSSTKFAGEEQYMKGFRDGIDDVIKNPEDYGLLPTPF